jgi:phosphotriesterase-related protein
MAVTTHAVMSPIGLRQLDILEEAGADPARVVIGHSDSYPLLDHWLAIVERGAAIECDFLGMGFTPMERRGEPRIIDRILELLARGHGDRILFSQDVCDNSQLVFYGGNGYAYLAERFLPRLVERGVGDAEIRRLTVDNPGASHDHGVGGEAQGEPVGRARAGLLSEPRREARRR